MEPLLVQPWVILQRVGLRLRMKTGDTEWNKAGQVAGGRDSRELGVQVLERRRVDSLPCGPLLLTCHTVVK